MNKKTMKIISEKGFTGIDVTISVIILSVLIVVIVNLTYLSYVNVLEMKKSSNAMGYATMILEQVDERSYEEIDNNFLNNTLLNSTEPIIYVSTNFKNYTFDIKVTEIKLNLLKKVELNVKYKVLEKEKGFKLTKLKVKEIK